ncbi:cutinase family protein [Mycobacterium sp. RTGN3]|uniref:cutinase family protein n=1 Tax=unclassified Mycobacterium TaxID=2642494 RepID=UPI0039B0E443
MTTHGLARLCAVAVVTTWTVLVSPASLPAASAAPCPDVEAVFARGTFTPQGLGGIGDDFAKALRSKLGGKTLGVYAVVYPASIDFPTAVDGIRDASNHIEQTAANCPNTKLVLAGYSQGAAVIGFVTANAVPGGVDPADVPKPMPADVADHVAAVALWGKPDPQFMQAIDSPPVNVGPLYAGKTIELCAPGDPICSNGDDGAAHTSYTSNGMVDQAATYVAGRV